MSQSSPPDKSSEYSHEFEWWLVNTIENPTVREKYVAWRAWSARSETVAPSATTFVWKPRDPDTFPPVNVGYVIPHSIRRVAVYLGKVAWELELPLLPETLDLRNVPEAQYGDDDD